jgi:hypothetical protein
LRPIQGGKLKGKSDINPMWRIKKLTELFGPCGYGWKIEDEKFWTTPGAGGEVIAWCSIKLRWFDAATAMWSEPITGIGGSMMVELQKGNLVSNDEAFKMAHTDAISVACKALGFAADVYWQQDRTKYDAPLVPPAPAHICECCGKGILPVRAGQKLFSEDDIADTSMDIYGQKLCWACMKVKKQAGEGR